MHKLGIREDVSLNSVRLGDLSVIGVMRSAVCGAQKQHEDTMCSPEVIPVLLEAEYI